MLSLQYCKLIREQSKNAEEWMGCIRTKANKYEYKENDRTLKGKITNDVNNDNMMIKII